MKSNENHREFYNLLTQITFFESQIEKPMENLYNNFTHIKRSNLLEQMQMFEVFSSQLGHWRFAKLRFAKMRSESWKENEWQTQYWKENCMLWYPNLNNLCKLLCSNKMGARIAANWFKLIWYNLIRFNSIRFDFITLHTRCVRP